jgi:hypothetical protein
MNSKLMSISLLVKWIWRLVTESPSSMLWHRIIIAKYPGAYDIFNSNAQGGSPFWHNIHKINEFFKLGANFTLGNV